LEEYAVKKSTLEAELSRLSAEFALEKLVGKADIPTIASILPTGSVYLDFAVIAPFDFKQKRFEDKPYCLVFILLPGDPPRVALVDLGDAEAINQHIRTYHKVIQEAVQQKLPPNIETLQQPLRALHRLVLEPLLPYIKDRKQLFVSPDGSLNLIPFEALITPAGKYLVEEHSIQYIAAGRDIVRFKDTARAQGKALIMADPDYDLGEEKRVEVAKLLGVGEQVVRGNPSRDAGGLSFMRLPDTRQEAEAIEKALKPNEASCRRDKEALQEVLFDARSPRVLHVATHGYFLPDQKIIPQFGPGRDPLPPEALKAYENPMLRSGIALAGANTSQKQGKDYGLVSAEKLLGLRLKGTELVVLSACQTGVGEVQTGEGVFGLKRAFILSGARTVVMSLWSVPSTETTELMKSFYTKWAQEKKTKAEALREAKLELMKDNRNPFFWGAFVMVGDPGK
jgi:CHAT domain-containing protein